MICEREFCDNRVMGADCELMHTDTLCMLCWHAEIMEKEKVAKA